MSVGRLGSLVFERILDPIEATHRGAVHRWYRRAGGAGSSPERVHDGVVGTVYAAIRAGGTLAGAATDVFVRADHEVHDASRAVASGIWGDRLGVPALAQDMEIRDRPGVAVPGPGVPVDPTAHLVVLVHGLALTERSWDDQMHTGLASRIEAHPDLTCLRVRYNTGLPIADSGSMLAERMDGLVSTWPVPVDSITLIGHSMGGLVIRAACETGEPGTWFDHVRHVVTLGTPHSGAPMARAVDIVGRMLGAFPSTRPFAESLDQRSAGIRDLEHGTITEEATGRRSDAELRDGPAYHFLAGAVTADPAHPVGWSVGDLLVRASSATAKRRLTPTSAPVMGGLNHMAMLADPVVADHVMNLIEPGTPESAGSQTTAASKATPTP